MFEGGGQEGEVEGGELDSIAVVELVLELHPVKSEGVEEGRQPLHDQQDGHSEHRKEAKHRDQKRHPDSGGDPQTQTHHHAPQHLRQLSVSQAEGPETQVRRCVGNATQAELDGVDGLVQQHVGKVKLQNACDITG